MLNRSFNRICLTIVIALSLGLYTDAGFAGTNKEAMEGSASPMVDGGQGDEADTRSVVKSVEREPISTFGIDVATESYINIRRFLNQGRPPATDMVKLEEMINHFPYDYELPKGDVPFAMHTALMVAPWNADRLLLRVAIKGQDLAKQTLPAANLVFLVDVSASMDVPDKLLLLRSSLKFLVNRMRAQDTIALVTYGGRSRIVLPTTSGKNKASIVKAIDQLIVDESDQRDDIAGIELAFVVAQRHFIKDGINRILLATDDSLNRSDAAAFERLIDRVAEKKASGISLSTLGLGASNHNDPRLKQLARAGNGAYSYIDTLREGHEVLANEMTSLLETIAKHVEVQVRFNPLTVETYRMLGYEDGVKEPNPPGTGALIAADVRAGHEMTVLYELTSARQRGAVASSQDDIQGEANTAKADLLAAVDLFYHLPEGDVGYRLRHEIMPGAATNWMAADAQFRLAVAVAGLGQLLRKSQSIRNWQYLDARALALSVIATDIYGYRGELVRLISLAQSLAAALPPHISNR